MDNIPGYLQVLGGVVTIATLLGAVYIAFRASYNTARIKALREDNEDLRLRVEDHDRALSLEKQKTATLKLRVETCEAKNRTLEALVIQRAEVEEAKRLVQEHHDATIALLEEIKGTLRKWE